MAHRYCPEHATISQGPCPDCQGAKKARAAHYATSAYKRDRATQIAAHPQCDDCGSTHDLTADHRIALRNGGTSEPSNLQTLCRACNGRKGARITR